MFIKKGAMFGLDARIALAIFGALSVISGAALYSAIQEAKVIALISEFAEAKKAWEAYYLDTGEQPPVYPAGKEFFDASYLVEDNSITGWQGPYLPFLKDSSTPYWLSHSTYSNLIYINTTDVSWGEGGNSWVTYYCPTGGLNCYSWIMILESEDLGLVKALDEKYDGVVDAKSGNFRWYQVAGKYRLILKNIKFN
ncbi:MAG TPA: hypothetical protein DCL21_05820 [Alphaproteobacteria bacterium]|nr:hypothetical protein [Alphaproteobacteria bacterium]